LKDVLDQIRLALNQNLYYVALWTCLTLPDICGAIDSTNGQADPGKYARWYDKWVARNCPSFTGQDCYYFRCTMLHQGRMMIPRGTYSRVFFLEPGATSNIFHCNVFNNALNIDLRIFCEAMIDGAERWLKSVVGTPLFTQNYNSFVRRYPTGIPPYVVGTPVIG